MMLWKCYTQYVSKFGKLSSGLRTGKGQFSFQSKRRSMLKNLQTTTQWRLFCMLIIFTCVLSHVRFFAILWTVAHQATLFIEFFRQEYWDGLPFPSPMHEWKVKSEVAQSCPTLRNPMDCSLPGSWSFQARVLEWGASAFSEGTTSDNSKTLYWKISFHCEVHTYT